MVESFNGKINLKEADEDESSLLVEIMNFERKQNRKMQRTNKRKNIFLTNCMHFLNRERVLDAFEREIFPTKVAGTGFSDKV